MQSALLVAILNMELSVKLMFAEISIVPCLTLIFLYTEMCSVVLACGVCSPNVQFALQMYCIKARPEENDHHCP